MPVVTVLPDRLELRLTRAERVLALHRGDVVVERSSIRSATVTEDPWIWVRGIRAPGTAVPLTLAAGTWKFHGGKDFLLIKRTAAAVVIDLVDEEYSRLIVSTKHAPELIAALQLGTATSAIPVIETDDLVVVPAVAEQAAERLAAAQAEAERRDERRPAEETPAAKETVATKPAAKKAPTKKPAPEKPAPKKPAPKKPAAAKPRPDSSVGHASAEPSGATEAAE
ncbi:hypothetical protein EDF54_0589 [Rathayibacter sp. PhB93]|uniref:hypothetical protein n=1 Tax=unclassified Rathayibacter TaxID=2609250 RepID=UPI000F9110E2|nr:MULTISPECIES: hypothetical protein [unclassified Rathayibacter]ROQ15722.1 hypothetical protein EDF54_0589 [Rathayibacter sp. PhB93]TDQ15661.1 hypothetical protein EDF17_0334 [Rathayibacter sp. PhB1]